MFWLARYQNTQVQCQICDSRRWRRSLCLRRSRRCRWQTRQWKCLSSALALKNKINTPHTLTERAQPRLLATSFCHFVECERMRSLSPLRSPPSLLDSPANLVATWQEYNCFYEIKLRHTYLNTPPGGGGRARRREGAKNGTEAAAVNNKTANLTAKPSNWKACGSRLSSVVGRAAAALMR